MRDEQGVKRAAHVTMQPAHELGKVILTRRDSQVLVVDDERRRMRKRGTMRVSAPMAPRPLTRASGPSQGLCWYLGSHGSQLCRNLCGAWRL